jgi:hypothetical protein
MTGPQVQQPFNGDEPGDSVCNYGAFTGRSCGVIQTVNLDNFVYLGVDLLDQRRATYVRAAGDSGGPVGASIGLDAAGSPCPLPGGLRFQSSGLLSRLGNVALRVLRLERDLIENVAGTDGS